MRHTNTHIPARAKKILSAWTIASIVLTLVRGPSAMVQTAVAASSFRPTIFVNTEAFLAIDDDDTTADVVLRFGDTLAKTLSFNRTLDRFEFNDDVYTSGSLTASGTIVTESGAYIDGTTLVVQANSDRVGIGTAAPLANLHIVGAETRLDTGTTNGTTSLSFVDNNDEKAHFLLNQATGTFDIQSDGRIDIGSSDYVNVSGTNYTNIQGSTTFTGNNVGIGTTGPKTRLDVVGAISGSFVYATRSFSGAGLSDCDSGTSKLLWDATTGRFSCGTVSSGISLADGDARYVKKSGDTMTGALAVQNGNTHTPTGTPLLNVRGMASGATLYANAALRSSGSLTWEGQGSGAKLFVKDFLSVGSRASGSLLTIGRVGSGTRLATMTNATLFSTDQMALGQLEGGAYFGRVGIKENQWGLNNYGNAFAAKAPTKNWSSIAMSSDGKLITASAESEYIYTSSDYGTTWTAKASQLIWQDVAMSSDGLVQTAVAYNDYIYTSYDYGNTWTQKGSSQLWNSIAASSDGRIMAATVNGGAVYVSTDYGNTWNAQTSNRDWRKIAISSDGKIMVATVSAGKLYVSYDYGRTWTAKDQVRSWFAVAMSSDGKIMSAAVSGGKVYISKDYGNTWTEKDQNRTWFGLTMSSDGKIMAAAVYSSGFVYISTDYGNTWNAQGSARNWYEIAMSSDGKVIASPVYNGQIHISHSDSFQYGSVAIGTGSVKGSTKLMVQGILSGVTLYATRSFSGAGLSDCDTAGTSKLLWDATTGRFSCGTDAGATYTAGQGLTLNSTSFRLSDSVSGTLLEFQTVSGATVYAERQLSVSGSVTLGEDAADNIVFNADVNSNITPNTNNSFDFGSSSARWANLWANNANLSANISVLGTSSLTGNVGIGSANTTTKATLNVSGIASGVTLYATRSFSGAGLSDCDTAGTSKLLWDATTGRFSCGTDQSGSYTAGQGLTLTSTSFKVNDTLTGSLLRFLTVSGSTVYAKNLLTSSGTIVTESGAYIDGSTFVVQADNDRVGIGTAEPAGKLHVMSNGDAAVLDTGPLVVGSEISPTKFFVAGFDTAYEGAYFQANSAGAPANMFLNPNGGNVGIGTNSPLSKLAIAGNAVIGDGYKTTIAPTDGLLVEGNVGIGTVSPKTKLSVVGAISGSFLYATRSFSGAGLSDCDTAGTSKLLWDATTGRFSCGTDQGAAYTAGQGLTLNGSSFRVNSTLTGSMLRFLTVSGSTVFAKDTLTTSGTIILKNTTTSADMLVTSTVSNANAFFDSAANANAGIILRENIATKWTILGQGTNDNFVISGDGGLGTDDFLTIGQSGNVGIGPGGTITPKAKLAVTGTISGTTVYALNSFSGAGLSDCDTAGTSKLLWDATTGRFSCGTDQTGGGGFSLSDGDARYVRKSGDTMTGALAVQNGNTHSATTTPLINVRGTMSGRLLNISGSGASPLLTTTSDKPTVRIGGSGSLVIEARSTDPGSAPANTSNLFAQKVGGRTMLHQGSGSTFAASPLQNALFGNLIMSITTGAGTTVNGYGTTVTNDTTVSHPAAGETFGYMTNFATSTTANDEAGTSSTNVAFFRGSTAGANGFFYYARVGVVDTTSITVYSGMADQTIATMVGADNPAGNHVGFQFSTGRGDTNWQFETRDGTTQNVVNTGLAFTANKVYDLMFTCTKRCASITWEIRNVTDGTSAMGTTSNNLPTAGTALRMVLGVETETTAARNIRMQQLYVEADR